MNNYIDYYKNLLSKIDKLIKALDDFKGKKISEAPENIKIALKKIPGMPTITSSGLESVDSIINNLYICKYAAENLIEKASSPKVKKTDIEKTKPPTSEPTKKLQPQPMKKSALNQAGTQAKKPTFPAPQPKSKLSS